MKQYIVFSHEAWASSPTRTQNLVTRLGESQVLFFQPASGPRDKRWKEEGRKVRPNVTLYTLPPDGSLSERHSYFQKRSLHRQAAFAEKQAARHRFREPVLWLTCPDQFPFVDYFNYRGIVYDCDRFWPSVLEDRESELAVAADVIFAASPLLKRRLSPCSPNVALLPNGVNYSMFCRTIIGVPTDLSDIAGPILGWEGAIDQRLDLSPVKTLAQRHPRWTIVLLGPVSDCPAVRELADYPNVRFLGERPLVDLPDYLSRFHVLLHLRRFADADSDVIPSRIYEYLSTGRPVVSLLFPDEVEEFPDVIYGAHNLDEFVHLCEKALGEDPTWVAPRRKDYGEASSWSRRAEDVRQILGAISL